MLPPNWRAQRKRDRSNPEEEDRPPKRPRASVDSGYTSTEGDAPSSWAPAQSPPEDKGQLVLEIQRPPGFDPSEYRVITSSQSAPSSQALPSDLVASQGDSNQQPGSRFSLRTIPDSQDLSEPLHTQSTAQSAVNSNFVNPVLSQRVSQPEPDSGSSQEASKDQQDSGGQTSKADLDIPSRQPEESHPDPGPSFGLLETREPTQATTLDDSLGNPSSSRPRQQLGGQESPSTWGEGFLTQPDYELPISLGEAESFQTGVPLSSSRGLNHDLDEQGLSALRRHSFVSESQSHTHFQAAQRVSLSDSISGQILTQVSQPPGTSSLDVVPETVQRPPTRRLPSQIPNRSASSPQTRTGSPLTPPAATRYTSLPPTSQTHSMDGPGEGPPRPSALEMMRKLREDVFGTSGSTSLPVVPENQNMDGSAEMIHRLREDAFGRRPESKPPAEIRQELVLASPSAVIPVLGTFAQQLEASTAPTDDSSLTLDTSSKEQPSVAAQDLNQSINTDFGVHLEGPIGGGHGIEFEQPPATVAPADLTHSVEHISSIHDDPSPGHQMLDIMTLEDSAPTSGDVDPGLFSPGMSTDEQGEDDDSHGRHFTVTLPMAANTRATYLETIKENKATMIRFGAAFGNAYSTAPDESLVVKIDAIFERLLNLCDLPAYDHDLPDLGKEEMMKHATNSNSKFSFVYEFLDGLWDINARILILSAPGRAFDYLEAVVSATDCPYTILGQEDSTGQEPTEGISVILAVAGQDLSIVEGGIDVVIAFDHAARSIELPVTLGYDNMAPMILSLVATYSLDHIGQQLLQAEQVMDSLDSFERRGALNLATAKAMDYLKNPESQHIAPHEAAKTFANFLRHPDGGLEWEPHPLPADFFEIWLSSQDRAQASQAPARQEDVLNGPAIRKRPLVYFHSSSSQVTDSANHVAIGHHRRGYPETAKASGIAAALSERNAGPDE